MSGSARKPARMRVDGSRAARYTWHVAQVAQARVLVVIDESELGESETLSPSVTNDAEGVVRDLMELRPDLLRVAPLIAYRDSFGTWDALQVGRDGVFAGFLSLDAHNEGEAVARVIALLER